MPVCTYDNPSTMHRECWQDSKLICSYSAILFALKKPIPGEYLFFGANVGDWETGQLIGDSAAIKEE